MARPLLKAIFCGLSIRTVFCPKPLLSISEGFFPRGTVLAVSPFAFVIAFGDQAMFMERSLFEELGGCACC